MSPMKAPRAFPTCSGPVGLADTNSTLTERAGPADDPAPARRVGEDRLDGRLEGAVAQPEVEEAGRCDLGGGDRCGGGIAVCLRGDLSGERRADGQRRHPVWASELHREVAREVPVGRVGWSLDLDGGAARVVRPGGKRTGRDGPIPGAPDRRADVSTEGRRCLESGRIRVGQQVGLERWVPDGSGATARLAGRARSPVTSPVLSYLAVCTDRCRGAPMSVQNALRSWWFWGCPGPFAESRFVLDSDSTGPHHSPA